MGAAGAKLAETYQKKANLDEERARKRIIQEAEKFGAELEKPDAKGGLPAQLVLDSLRRDRYRCKRCGSRKKIGPHHKGGIVESRWLSEKGHANVLPNIATLCARCHDAVHNQAREDGVDSGQVLPEADAGTKKDRGQAKVDPKKIQALLTHRKRVQAGAAGGATDWTEDKHPRDHGRFSESPGLRAFLDATNKHAQELHNVNESFHQHYRNAVVGIQDLDEYAERSHGSRLTDHMEDVSKTARAVAEELHDLKHATAAYGRTGTYDTRVPFDGPPIRATSKTGQSPSDARASFLARFVGVVGELKNLKKVYSSGSVTLARGVLDLSTLHKAALQGVQGPKKEEIEDLHFVHTYDTRHTMAAGVKEIDAAVKAITREAATAAKIQARVGQNSGVSDSVKALALLKHHKRVLGGAAGGATDWDESKHPRGDHGMFGEGGGGVPGGRQGDPKVSALVERARVAAERGNGKGLKAAHRLGGRAIAATSDADRTKATAKLADHVARLERKQGAVTDLGKVSGKEADTWGNGEYKEWHQSLAPEERQAITKYTANGVEFRTAQRRLRGMSPPDPKSGDHEIDPMIEHLDKALSRSKLPSSLQAYRGAVGMPVPKVGSTFVDKGYMSTSVRQESTQAYLEQATGSKIFYKILLPKGTKGGYVSSLGPNPQDNEVLLPRGSKFRITKVTELNPNHHEVEMHIVDD